MKRTTQVIISIILIFVALVVISTIATLKQNKRGIDNCLKQGNSYKYCEINGMEFSR